MAVLDPKSRFRFLFPLLVLALVLLTLVDLMVGDRLCTPWELARALCTDGDPTLRHILLSVRGTRTVVAVLIGIALPLCGLMMQTVFQNPLADPYILGVSSGTGLGVALFVLGVPLLGLPISSLGVLGSGFLGALAVVLLILTLSRRIGNIFGVLIIGVMLSYVVSSVIQILQYYSSAEQLRLFTLWSLGSLGGVTRTQLSVMLPILLLGVGTTIASIKSLNLLLLGDYYAESMGLNIRRSRLLILGSTALMTGAVTAFCGPIGFIGLAVPHVARYLVRSADHRVLLPATALLGSCAMLLCNTLAKLFLIPINSVTALLGVPIILGVILKQLNYR